MEANKVLIAVGAISTDRAPNGLRRKSHIRCSVLIKIAIRAIFQWHSRAVILTYTVDVLLGLKVDFISLSLSRWQTRTLDLTGSALSLSLSLSRSTFLCGLSPQTPPETFKVELIVKFLALRPAQGVSSQHYVNFTAYIWNLECYHSRLLHRVTGSSSFCCAMKY